MVNIAYKRQTLWVFEICIYLRAHFLKKEKKNLNNSNWKSEEKAKRDEKKALLTINAVQEEGSDTVMLVGSDNLYLPMLTPHEERNVSLYQS